MIVGPEIAPSPQVSHNETSRVVAFVGKYTEAAAGLRLAADGQLSVKIEIYYTTMIVKTSLEHPVQGKTQQFRGHEFEEVSGDILRDVLMNPRVHTGAGWKTKDQRAAKEGQASRKHSYNAAAPNAGPASGAQAVAEAEAMLEQVISSGFSAADLARHDAALRGPAERRQFHCPEHGTWFKKVPDPNKPVARCKKCPLGPDGG